MLYLEADIRHMIRVARFHLPPQLSVCLSPSHIARSIVCVAPTLQPPQAALAAAAWHTTRPCRTGATSDGTTTAGVAVVIVSARGHATAITGLVRSPLSDAVASQMHPPLALASPTVRPRSSLLTRAQLRWRLRSSSRKSSCLVPVLARRQQASAAGAPDCRHSSAEAEAEASAAAAHRRASRRRRRES